MQDNANRTNGNRHLCLEWDSNPLLQHSSKEDIHILDRAATVIGKAYLKDENPFIYLENDEHPATSRRLGHVEYTAQIPNKLVKFQTVGFTRL
jgi:hypothetical protein